MRLHFPFPRHIKTRYIKLNTRLCKACWKCIAACPHHVIGKAELLSHRHAHIDNAGGCKGCKKCVQTCPQKAILFIYQRSGTARQHPV